MLKKFLRPIHLILGLLSGLVLFTVSITGCINAFEEEIRAIAYDDLMTVAHPSGKMCSPDSLLSIAKRYYDKAEVKNIRIKPDRISSVEVVFTDRESVFINPYNSRVLGSVNKDKDFFGVALDVHKNLYLEDTGEIITGASALIFLFMLISGIILWWPKKKKEVKEKFSVKRNVNWRKKSYDLHSVLGFYACWIIIFTVLSGLVWSYDWAEESLYWMTDSKMEKRIEIPSDKSADSLQGSIEKIYAESVAETPIHKECIINLPKNDKGSYQVVFRYNDKGFYRKQDQLFFDQYSGKLIKKRNFSDLPTGAKLKMTNLNIHTGKVFGFTGQLLVFFASLICASLPITGFMIWWGKRKTSQK